VQLFAGVRTTGQPSHFPYPVEAWGPSRSEGRGGGGEGGRGRRREEVHSLGGRKFEASSGVHLHVWKVR
jgi:hypothetical protein